MARWLPTIAALFLAPVLVGGQVQYGPSTRYEGGSTEVKVSVPASAGGAGTYCFQVRAIDKVATELPSEWSRAYCARLTPPVTVTLAWDPPGSPPSLRGSNRVRVAYEVRVGLAPDSTTNNLPAAGISESMFADRRPETDYQETKAYELGARFVPTRSGRVIAVRFFKGSNEAGRHTGRVWSTAGQLLAEVAFENETPSGWQEERLPKPVPVKAGAQFVVSVTTDPSGHYVVTPDDLGRPLDRGSLRADGAVFGSLGKFPRTRRPDNFFRDVVFIPDP
jgi:Domain of unknown function (DUF4082)